MHLPTLQEHQWAHLQPECVPEGLVRHWAPAVSLMLYLIAVVGGLVFLDPLEDKLVPPFLWRVLQRNTFVQQNQDLTVLSS